MGGIMGMALVGEREKKREIVNQQSLEPFS